MRPELLTDAQAEQDAKALAEPSASANQGRFPRFSRYIECAGGQTVLTREVVPPVKEKINGDRYSEVV